MPVIGVEPECHPIEEVLNRRLGHSRQDSPVQDPAQCAEGWHVPSADRQLGSFVLDPGDLEISVESREEPGGAHGRPAQRHQGLRSEFHRLSQLDLYGSFQANVVPESDIREENIPLVRRGSSQPGQARLWAVKEQLQYRGRLHPEFNEIPGEHPWSIKAAPTGPNGQRALSS